MLNKVKTYYFLGRCLALDIQGNKDFVVSTLNNGEISNNLLVSIASNHLVLQTLYSELILHNIIDLLDNELYLHLKHIFQLNRERNNKVLQQVKNITSVLNGAGIEPLFTKGIGNMLDDLYTTAADRIVVDIDLLLEEEKWKPAVELLKQDGYKQRSEYMPLQLPASKHYPRLFKEGEPVYVEVHWVPVIDKYVKHFNNDIIFSSKVRPLKSSINCFVMCDIHKIIHNFIHSQLENRGHRNAHIYLRNLYDLYLLSKRKDPETVLMEFNQFTRGSSGYIAVMNKIFGIEPIFPSFNKIGAAVFNVRHSLNIRIKIILYLTLIANKIFRSYIKKSFKAIVDKELRNKLLRNLHDPKWFKNHIKSYRRMIHGYHHK